MEFKPLVSVIVPVYNASNTLHIAIESLIVQTYLKLELIFVNDYSEDNSLVLLETFQKDFSTDIDKLVKIISHEQNFGVAVARNTGLDNATGDYIYYLDADDRIDHNAIELIVEKALETQADIVGCNWFLTFEKNERKMNQPSFKTPWEAIQNILNGSMRWNLWLFMVRRSLYEDFQIRFIPGMNMGEDMMVMIKLFLKASKVTYLNKALYHYGQSNEQSLTRIYSEAHIQEVTANVMEVERCLLKSSFADQLDDNLDFLKLNIKLPLLISDQVEQYRRWLNWFPEANNKVMANKSLSFRTRLIQWLTVKEQFWAIKLYYRMVIRFVYGKLYK